MLRRLLIAFIFSALAAVLCWLILPKLNVPIPWWVPLLAFILMAIPAVLTGIEWPSQDRDESPQPADQDFHPPGTRED